MLWYTPGCRSITHCRRATCACCMRVCVHGLVFTKAMNTGCGINSDDGLNVLEIRVVRRKRRLPCVNGGHDCIIGAPDPSNIRIFSRLAVTVSRSLKTILRSNYYTNWTETIIRIEVFNIDEGIHEDVSCNTLANEWLFGDRFILFPTWCYVIISSLHFARVSDIRQPHAWWCALFSHRTCSHRHFYRRSFARIIMSRLVASTLRLTYAIRNLPPVGETARGKS